jgi:hypothetical protein
MSQEATDRAKFLQDVIAELSRQKEEDDLAFQGLRLLSAEVVFKKLCFDFPSVDDKDIQQLCCAIEAIVLPSKTAGSASFRREFFLHQKFLDNTFSMCISSGGGQSKESAAFHIACVIYTCFTTYLLNCSIREAGRMLTGSPEDSSLGAVLKGLCATAKLSNVSVLCGEGAQSDRSAILTLLQSSGCIDCLCEAINCLGAWVVRAEEVSGDAVAGAEDMERTMQELNEAGGTASVTPTRTLLAVLKTMSDRARASAEDKTAQAALHATLSLVKPAWLHMAMFLRDLLAQFPSLVPAKAALLLAALSGESSSTGGSSFPTSVECAHVLVLASLCAQCVTGSTCSRSGSSATVVRTVAMLLAKGALKSYLDRDCNLSRAVDICTRMAERSDACAKTSSAVNAVDLDVLGFLVDIASVYCCDPDRAAVASCSRSPSAAAAHPLIASRLLPSLLFNFLALLRQQQQQLSGISSKGFSPVTVAITDR